MTIERNTSLINEVCDLFHEVKSFLAVSVFIVFSIRTNGLRIFLRKTESSFVKHLNRCNEWSEGRWKGHLCSEVEMGDRMARMDMNKWKRVKTEGYPRDRQRGKGRRSPDRMP